ncbi:hydroxyisourate hydrolase [Aquabacterium lacunae]|uniref:5-hydroxyisourate hydrolase n=1 Tax=Aquabacterium lacunae TaxID=2528630 RepID=A0A4Q9H5E7_9BURK|nr:hydroxyisourate hydrolase [Aquabacterium lacunae]TBO33010.1 hydroxyisourate hydrolase [Aquabacterium lacunae]
MQAPEHTPSSASLGAATGRLSTHVLDTVKGGPAVGMAIELYVRETSPDGCADGRWLCLRTVSTNHDGRIDGPLLAGDDFKPGCYRLVFDVEGYFRAQGAQLPSPAFLGKVPLDFGIADGAGHYHVPLLVSPWSYSTYRGS